MFTSEVKRRQLLPFSPPLCCAVAGRASQSILPCPPVDSGNPTPPTSPAPPPTPGTVSGPIGPRQAENNNNNAPLHRLLFIAHSEHLSFPVAVCSRPTFSCSVRLPSGSELESTCYKQAAFNVFGKNKLAAAAQHTETHTPSSSIRIYTYFHTAVRLFPLLCLCLWNVDQYDPAWPKMRL